MARWLRSKAAVAIRGKGLAADEWVRSMVAKSIDLGPTLKFRSIKEGRAHFKAILDAAAIGQRIPHRHTDEVRALFRCTAKTQIGSCRRRRSRSRQCWATSIRNASRSSTQMEPKVPFLWIERSVRSRNKTEFYTSPIASCLQCLGNASACRPLYHRAATGVNVI
jgi:hypothetical protein